MADVMAPIGSSPKQPQTHAVLQMTVRGDSLILDFTLTQDRESRSF